MTPNGLQLSQINPSGGIQLPLTIGCREVYGHCEVELGPGGLKWPWGDIGGDLWVWGGAPLWPQAGLGAPISQFRAPPSVPALRCQCCT